MQPSIYQQKIYDWVLNSDGNLVIEAVAGSGKTTTIVHIANKLLPSGGSITKQFFAFNKSIQLELRERLPNDVSCDTLHSFGLQILRANYGSITIDDNKFFNICKLYQSKWNDVPKDKIWAYFFKLKKIIDISRNFLTKDIGDIIFQLERNNLSTDFPDFQYEVHIERALSILKKMDESKSVFDFSDMIYRPLKDELKIPKRDWVLIDECQDLNIAQQGLFQATLKKSSRFIAVGDPYQAIYGFAGADAEAFEKLSKIDNTIQLPLSVCYRCDKTIVEMAQNFVNHILPFEDKEAGTVRKGSVNEILPNDWVICRNTKPLVVLFFYLLKKGIKSTIKTDLGESLSSLIDDCESDSMIELQKLLLQKKFELNEKLIKNNSKSNAEMFLLDEKLSLVKFLSNHLKTLNQLKSWMKKYFNSKEPNTIQLMTVHKSKGLENERIFVVRFDALPSQFATQSWQLQQETNLSYVLVTRAKKELVFIDDWVDLESKNLANLKSIEKYIPNEHT